MITFYAERPDVINAIKALQVDARTKIKFVAEAVGAEVVAYLRSLTSELRPSVTARGGGWTHARQAHPGHWADVTSQLALSYYYEVVVDSMGGVSLLIGNSAEYAIWLELREGFFVVRGVADRGGPVAQALAKIIPEIAPGWQVQL